jgi:DNA invertase Pin-like site-specific DNA recombinase
MSDDKQENSIDRQRSAVEPYAPRKGYQIIREYIDPGIPGDEEKRRKDFLRMLKDAGTLRDFKAILCDDKDRFGRFDSITQGYYVKPLRDAGVWLETVAQGKIDWGSFAGRITDAVLQEAKKLESQATSRRVMTRMLMMAKDGKWLGGRPPYGYTVALDPVLGKRLVPGDPAKIRAVQLIFRLCGDQHYTLEAIAQELRARGIPNPRGGEFWSKSTIVLLLRNRKYVGDLTWNCGHDGKYTEFRGGSISTSDGKTPKHTNRPEDWVVIPDCHEPLVDRELFCRVQEQLDKNRTLTTPLRRLPKSVLCGLLICGDCGHPMMTANEGGKRYYRCQRYHEYGKTACYANLIAEKKLVAAIAGKIQEVFLNPENLDKLRAEVKRQLEEAGAGNPAALDGLRRQIADLDAKIASGTGRLLEVPADMVARCAAMIREWEQEKARLVAELLRLDTEADLGDLEEGVRVAEEQLYRLREAIADGNPADVRAVLVELVSRVELHFQHPKTAKTTRSIFEWGCIYIRTQQDVALPAEYAYRSGEVSPTRVRQDASRRCVPASPTAPGERHPVHGLFRGPGPAPEVNDRTTDLGQLVAAAASRRRTPARGRYRGGSRPRPPGRD